MKRLLFIALLGTVYSAQFQALHAMDQSQKTDQSSDSKETDESFDSALQALDSYVESYKFMRELEAVTFSFRGWRSQKEEICGFLQDAFRGNFDNARLLEIAEKITDYNIAETTKKLSMPSGLQSKMPEFRKGMIQCDIDSFNLIFIDDRIRSFKESPRDISIDEVWQFVDEAISRVSIDDEADADQADE